MNVFIQYSLQVQLILLLSMSIYWLFFRKSVRFSWLRFVQLSIIIGSCSFPFLPAPDLEMPTPVSVWNAVTESPLALNPDEVLIQQDFISIAEVPVVQPQARWNAASLIYYLKLIYITGILILGLRLIWQLLSLSRILAFSRKQEREDYILVLPEKDIAPFSFFRWIVVNPNRHNSQDLQMILRHEYAHARQGHSIDILLSELLVVMYWMNPAAWYLRKIIRQNLEFLADEEVLTGGVNRKSYQYSLLQLSCPGNQLQLVNHFNQSLIKKRIVMMNMQKSPDRIVWRYAALAVLFTGMLAIHFPVKAQFPKERTLSPHTTVAPAPQVATTLPAEWPAASTSIQATTRSFPRAEAVSPSQSVLPKSRPAVSESARQHPSAVTITESNEDVTAVISSSSQAPEVLADTLPVPGRVAIATSTSTGISSVSSASGVAVVSVGDSNRIATGIRSAGVVATGKATTYTTGVAVTAPETVNITGNVFGIYRSNISKGILKEIHAAFDKRGIDLRYLVINFNDQEELTHLKIAVKDWSGKEYVSELGNGEEPINGFILLYLIEKSEGNYEVGLKSEYPSAISSRELNILKRLTGLAITKKNGKDNYIRGHLE